MKRVYALYRVSTLGQVDKDDIPMQRKACHEFVSKNEGWILIEEFSEKGVSGFKISAKDRDVIQEIQKAAIEKKFDILLVFMFDRIGRKDDETPFVVEWFVQHGIEVWSVNEGQQRFDNHVDKLLNYIRYWQAAGESIKTSIRVSTSMGQIVQEGHFRGGSVPYGYRAEHLGRVNKKGHQLTDLVVDEIESAIVRVIFDRYVRLGMGPQSIAAFLADENIYNRKGERFVSGTIRNMVRNPMYRGILRSGKSFSEPFDHLRIIDDDIFSRAQDIISQRSDPAMGERFTPRKYSVSCLLTGNIYCGNCGGRLITSTSGKKRTRKDGTVVEKRFWRYLCYNRMRHKEKCDGQSGFTATKIDEIVIDTVRDILCRIKAVPLSSIIGKRHEKETEEIKANLLTAGKNLKKLTDDLSTLKLEVVNVLRGESVFTAELLNETIGKLEGERRNAQASVDHYTDALADSERRERKFKIQHDRLVEWSDIFDGSEFDEKKMIVYQLVDKVFVDAGYEISIEFTETLKEYLEFSEHDLKSVA